MIPSGKEVKRMLVVKEIEKRILAFTGAPASYVVPA